jgi:ribonuclease P/MRP protein subunit POP5
MKPLLPTLKEKKRYIVYNVMSEQPVTGAQILSAVQKILGVFESATAGLQCIGQKKNRGVFKTSLKSVSKVRAALTLLKEIGGKKVRITISGVSGILNKTERFQ